MMSTFPPMVIGGVVITSLSFLLHIIAFSTTYWYTFGDVIHMGLWKSCYQSKGVEACSYYTELPVSDAHLIAAAVLESLALVAFVVAVICAFLKMFVLKEKGNMFAITGVFNLIAGEFALIGTIVFATESYGSITMDSSKFHYSFGLCIVGGIGGIFSGIVFLVAWRWWKN
ncbi:epithelial membrane protein 3-like isoform X1 [Mytilus trossulus]|uniref:epithelial membrane protein 3-like isoform X1 n=1 Tax=Mytilus trossulus TaxID=6551 RepID=UPI003007880C